VALLGFGRVRTRNQIREAAPMATNRILLPIFFIVWFEKDFMLLI
jgi:hypothetical protein